jgi:hypothetical protein
LIIEDAANTRQKEQRVLHSTKRKLGFHLEYLLHHLHNEECSSSMNGDVHGNVSILVRANLEESLIFVGTAECTESSNVSFVPQQENKALSSNAYCVECEQKALS